MAKPAIVEKMQPMLNAPYILRTRRNHGLEHATIHILSQRVRGLQMAGRSDAKGFVLIGECDTDKVVSAVSDALDRMKRGEHGLAVHPNCGTNLVTTGYMTGLTALLLNRASSDKDVLGRLPLMSLGMMGAVLVSQPMGMWLQKHITTEGKPGNLEVLGIERSRQNWVGREVTVHRVDTVSS